ncbi:hypothetical protein [Cognatilysobacter bugurensis]|uniref:Lipoprotein n=1 Tax=Cognatilysobacter bugurensis TaxID=543356 RepID=A0A918WBH4_9GAMM|nr:hypothetical protein [Lysobacter bugurensis]GHA87951.1 hypothetical protein GCM10007067_27490 [Lysobacter bugurensis]
MLRKLLLPLAAVALAGGCATMSDYQYRNGGTGGDYYYGRPGVDYRHHGGPYGHYPYGPSVRFGTWSRYGHPYYGNPYYGYYGHPYYGYPYYGGVPYRPPVVIVQPRPDGGHVDRDDNDRRPPWRDLNARRRMAVPDSGDSMRAPEPIRPTRSIGDGGDRGGSRMEQMIRRGREGGSANTEVEP